MLFLSISSFWDVTMATFPVLSILISKSLNYHERISLGLCYIIIVRNNSNDIKTDSAVKEKGQILKKSLKMTFDLILWYDLDLWRFQKCAKSIPYQRKLMWRKIKCSSMLMESKVMTFHNFPQKYNFLKVLPWKRQNEPRGTLFQLVNIKIIKVHIN